MGYDLTLCLVSRLLLEPTTGLGQQLKQIPLALLTAQRDVRATRTATMPEPATQLTSGVPEVSEKTFSAYNKSQGQAYAAARPDYHPHLYEVLLDHHVSSGGQLDTAIDLGCGPGQASRGLAPHFNHVLGLDPSQGMIETARSLGGSTSTSEPIRFEVGTATDLGRSLSPPVQDGSVDLITAANAAHWFDMSRFWPAAARVLKPGGSVAVWTSGKIRIHPATANAAAIQEVLEEFRDTHLKMHRTEGNVLTFNRYRDLPLPWQLEEPLSAFDKDSFWRREWESGEPFHASLLEGDMDRLEMTLSSGSPVTRWRQAHPEAVGTERDVVRLLRRRIETLLHEAGVREGQERVKVDVEGVLLVVKKRP